jgi:hypothetical protein
MMPSSGTAFLKEAPLSSHRVHDHPILGQAAPARTVRIVVDGVDLTADEGEPLAAALIAGGIHTFRTMPKSGEPRGGYCFVGRCGDCSMIVDGEPNVMACRTPVRDGMMVDTRHGLGGEPR